MGYNTKFIGSIKLSRALTIAEAKVILEANDNPDSIEGEHPKSYMQWVPTIGLDAIVYDGNEKFYDYEKWMNWILSLISGFGIEANGVIHWAGEDAIDAGILTVNKNQLAVSKAEKTTAFDHPLTLDALAMLALDQITKPINQPAN